MSSEIIPNSIISFISAQTVKKGQLQLRGIDYQSRIADIKYSECALIRLLASYAAARGGLLVLGMFSSSFFFFCESLSSTPSPYTLIG